MAPPDWQLPAGVNRGLWDYLHAADMVAGYDAQIAAAPLSRTDVAVCERAFATPGRLVDLGCGTGRLAVHFAARGFTVTGVDLSPAMLARARTNAAEAGVSVDWVEANLVDLVPLADGSFDHAACLFSTLGMVRGTVARTAALASMARILRPGGRLIVHAHNRLFPGLGRGRVLGQLARTLLGRPDAGELTMPQSYAGAALTLHHFTRGGLVRQLTAAGLRVDEVLAVDVAGNVRPAGVRAAGAYGFLAVATRAEAAKARATPPPGPLPEAERGRQTANPGGSG